MALIPCEMREEKKRAQLVNSFVMYSVVYFLRAYDSPSSTTRRRLRCLSRIVPRPWQLSLIGWGIGEGEVVCIVGLFVQLFGGFLCSFEGLSSSSLVLFLVAFLVTFYKISFLLIKKCIM